MILGQPPTPKLGVIAVVSRLTLGISTVLKKGLKSAKLLKREFFDNFHFLTWSYPSSHYTKCYRTCRAGETKFKVGDMEISNVVIHDVIRNI